MAVKKEKEEEKQTASPMDLYNRLRSVPVEALKTIGAGRLKGMSDINPMWRIQRMTEAFGICGFGWRYEIVKQWTENHGNEVKAYCNINLYVKVDDEWSEAIPGTGGSSEVSMERNGAYVSDECYKMALTDALSVAMKAIGVGADVYFAKGKNIVDPSTKYNLDEQLARNDIKPSQAGGGKEKVNPTDIFQAQEFLSKVKTKEQLQWIATTYKPLLSDPNFVAMCTAKKKELGIG